MKGKIFTAIILLTLVSCEKGDSDSSYLKFFTKAYKETAKSVTISKDNNGNDQYYFICGQFTDTLSSNAKGRPGVFKTDPEGTLVGNPLTLSDYEGSAAKIITLGDGDVICTGYVLNDGEKDIFVWRINSDMTTDKLRVYPAQDNQYGVDIIKTSAGFLILATTDSRREPEGEVTGNPAGKKDVLLMKIGNDLEPLTPIPAVGYNGNDEGVAVKEDFNGGFIVIGTTDFSDQPSSSQAGTNILLVRLNADGSTTEPRIVGGTLNEAAYDFEVLTDGYLIAGTKGTAGTTQQGWIWKMPVNIYNAPEYEHLVDLEPMLTNKTPYSILSMSRYKASSFLVAGQFGTGLSARMLIFSIDVYGTPDLNRVKKTGGTGSQTANDVISGDSDSVIAVGTNFYDNNSMACLLKFWF